MSGIDVDRLVHRESNVVAVQSAVRAAVEDGHRSLRQARNELLDVANTLGSSRGVSGTVDIPELEVCTCGSCTL